MAATLTPPRRSRGGDRRRGRLDAATGAGRRRPGDPRPVPLTGVPYNRGAMTLHALRGRVGDGICFRILREWASIYQYGHAGTPDFIRLAERESGMDLTNFFDVWLCQKGKPTSW